MASYATAADLLTYIDAKTLILLADDTRITGIADPVRLAASLTDAAARIDAALFSAGFVVPVAVPGALLVSLNSRLAISALYSRRPETETAASLDAIARGAEAELARITDGKLTPPEAVRGTGAVVSGGLLVSSDEDVGWGADL